jgi:hypothetical protein
VSTLAYQQSDILGTAFTTAAASGGGDKVAPHPRGCVLVDNGSGSSITVTVTTPGTDKYNQARADIPITVAAGASKLIGPFPQDLASDVDGLVAIGYSDVTTVTVAAILV